MKKFLCVALISVGVSYSQDVLSLYSLGDLPQVYHFNPAEYDEYPAALTLLTGIYADYNNSLAFSDILKETKKGYKFNSQSTLNRLGTEGVSNQVDIETKLDLFYYGYRLPTRNSTIRLFSNIKSYAVFEYPKELMESYLIGWGGDNVGRLFSDNLRARAMSFVELGVGITSGFGRALQLGGNIKYYHGLFFANTNDLRMSIISNRSDFSLEISSKNFDVSVTKQNLSVGFGFGVDLGFTYDFGLISEIPVRIGASLSDLGFIRWDVAKAVASDGSIVISDAKDINKINSLDKILTNYNTSTNRENNITMLVPHKLFGSVSYYPTSKDLFTFSTYNTFFRSGSYKEILTEDSRKTILSVGYSRKIWRRKISLSVNGVKLSDKPISLGVGMNARFGALQFYLASDDVMNVVDGLTNVSDNFRYANLRVGFNFLFGAPKVTGARGRGRSRYGRKMKHGSYKNRGTALGGGEYGGYKKGRSGSGGGFRKANKNNRGRGRGLRSGFGSGAVDTHEYICGYCRVPFTK